MAALTQPGKKLIPMLKKSIKARLIAVFLCAALVISCAVGVHAFTMTNTLLHEKADAMLATRCEAEASQLNITLAGVQRNVRLMGWYCLDRLKTPGMLTDPTQLSDFTGDMLVMFTATVGEKA